MKLKTYQLFLAFLSGVFSLQAQTNTLLYNGFDNYNGLPGTIEPGWYYSWNDTSNISFYTAAGYFGSSAPAYKFGFDSVSVISPSFTAADSLRFWMKGNGTQKDSNTFFVYTSSDSISWTLLWEMDSIPLSDSVITLPIGNQEKFIKFYFRKYVLGYNVGLDDIYVLKNSGVGINDPDKNNEFHVFPSPGSGQVTIRFNRPPDNDFRVYDLLGNEIKGLVAYGSGPQEVTLDLSGLQPGYYFIRILTKEGFISRRVCIQK